MIDSGSLEAEADGTHIGSFSGLGAHLTPRGRAKEATEQLLAPIRASVIAGRLRGAAAIGLRVGAVLNRYKVRKHFACEIRDAGFEYRRDADRIAHEAALDGVYVIRTSLDGQDLSAADCVRSVTIPRSTRT